MSFDTLERNLAHLFARAYVPVRARESFRAALEADFLARAQRFAKPAARIAPRATVWRLVAVAALVLVFAGLGWRLASGRGGAPSVAEILARGDIAVRVERNGAWSSHEANASFEHASEFLELRTPLAAGATVAGSDAEWTVHANSELTLERASANAQLARGGVGWRALSTETRVWTLATPAGGVRLLRATVEVVNATPRDGAALEAPPRADCAWVRVRAEVGAASAADGGELRFDHGEAWIACGAAVHPRALGGGPAVDERASVAGADEPVKPPEVAPKPALVEGVVTRASDGAPVEQFRVVLLPIVQLPQVGEPLSVDCASAQGVFAVPRELLSRDRSGAEVYRLEIQAAGFAPHRVDRFVPDADAPVVLEVALGAGASVRGIVVDDRTGLPIPDAWVVAEHDTPLQVLAIDPNELEQPALVVSTRTRSDGGFELANLRAGQHILRASAPGYGPSWTAPFALADDARANDVDLRLQTAARIEGSVLDELGQPLTDVVLIASTTDFTRPCLSFDFATPDSAGRFELVGLPAGYTSVLRFAASASAASLAPEMKFATLTPGATARVDFHALKPLQVLRGVVRDTAGLPVAGCSVMIAPHDRAGPPPEGRWLTCSTASDGSYEMPDVEPGRYELCVSGRTPMEAVHIESFEVAAGSAAVHDVVLPLGSIRGTVRDARTKESHPFAVLILTRSGGGASDVFFARGLADVRGEYVLPRLAPGVYDVYVYAPKSGLAFASRERIALGDGEQLTGVDFELGGGATFALSVSATDGEPVSGAVISCIDARGRSISFSERDVTDARGEYRAAGLQPGRWRVRVEAPGFTSGEVAFEAVVGEVHELALELERP